MSKDQIKTRTDLGPTWLTAEQLAKVDQLMKMSPEQLGDVGKITMQTSMGYVQVTPEQLVAAIRARPLPGESWVKLVYLPGNQQNTPVIHFQDPDGEIYMKQRLHHPLSQEMKQVLGRHAVNLNLNKEQVLRLFGEDAAHMTGVISIAEQERMLESQQESEEEPDDDTEQTDDIALKSLELEKRTLAPLLEAGITTLDQLLALYREGGKEGLLALDGFGPKGLDDLQQALEKSGVNLTGAA